jgi:hypothetical protein
MSLLHLHLFMSSKSGSVVHYFANILQRFFEFLVQLHGVLEMHGFDKLGKDPLFGRCVCSYYETKIYRLY